MSQAACRSKAIECRKVKGCTVMLMTHSVTFCRSSRGGMLVTVTYSRGKIVANCCVRHLDFLISVSTFSDCFRRIGMRPLDRRIDIPHSPTVEQITLSLVNPLNPELNPICYLLALLAHHFLHVSRMRVKPLTLRLLMLYIYIYIYIYIWSAYS